MPRYWGFPQVGGEYNLHWASVAARCLSRGIEVEHQSESLVELA